MIYDISTEPCDEQYHSFIDYAIAHSDAVMLIFSVKKGSKLQGEAKIKKNQCWLATCSHEQFGWAVWMKRLLSCSCNV